MAYLDLIRARVGRRRIFLVFAGACVRDDRGRVLWQRRADSGWWGLPGGILELDESLPQCARREVREETGLQVEPVRLVGVYSSPSFDVTYPNGDEVQQVTACFECRIVRGPSYALDLSAVDGAETLELDWLPAGTFPPTALWYEAMAIDLVLDQSTPSFRRGVAGRRQGGASFLQALREQVGRLAIIMPAAAGLVLDEAERVLLVRQGNGNGWSLPGGTMELGERIDRTVVNEIAVQTGLNVEPVRLVGLYSDSGSPGYHSESNQVKLVTALFICHMLGGRPGAAERRMTRAGFFSLDALPELEGDQAVQLYDGLAARSDAG